MMKRLQCVFTARSLGDRRFATDVSSESVDREGDSIVQSGIQLDRYRESPVVLWMHDHRQPPIARSIEIGVVNGRLRSVDEFPPKGMYPFADTIHDLVAGGFVRGKSIGFIPLTSEPRNGGRGLTFKTVELLEHSYVSVGANADALVHSRSLHVDGPALRRWLGERKEKDMVYFDVDPVVVRDACREVVANLRGLLKEQVGAELHPLARQSDRFCRTMAREIEHQAACRRLREEDEAERALRRALALAFHQPTSYGG